jgi:hypothetical protein
MNDLKNLNGKQLANLLNKLDREGKEDKAIIVESEMDLRYESTYKIKLLKEASEF